MNTLQSLEPKEMWKHFEDICQVPRPSKKEEQIIAFLFDFAHKNNLEIKRDEIGNILISKPATSGFENRPTVVLQSHMDMVCEKNADKVHDFMVDPITPIIDNGWVRADGTTLGADCGIGMAAQMAVLTDLTVKHGPIECLFTVDEETGLSGAFALEPGFITGNILLNLDSEDEGELFIGCAGGIDTLATFEYTTEEPAKEGHALEIKVSGLLGGHSGDEIHKGRGNANQILNRFLWEMDNQYGIQLASFDGGNLRNAIAREAKATIVVPSKFKEQVTVALNIFRATIEEELKMTEPHVRLDLSSTDAPITVIDEKTKTQLLNAIYACPHGVLVMSERMPGMVETSTNLASIKFKENNTIVATTSQRSDLESGKTNAAQKVESVFTLAGAKVVHSEGYPGWAPNPSSPILAVAKDSYTKLFGKEPLVRSIHAGLECGLFLEKYPQLDMISFGPTLRMVHSPDEKIEIETVKMFWDHLVDVLQKVK